jgi:hypothetical protein
VTFWLEPLDIAAVAVNCVDAPIEGVMPVTDTEMAIGDGVVPGTIAPPPQAARPNANEKAVTDPNNSRFIRILFVFGLEFFCHARKAPVR